MSHGLAIGKLGAMRVTPQRPLLQPPAGFGNGGDRCGPLRSKYRRDTRVYGAPALPPLLLPTLRVLDSFVAFCYHVIAYCMLGERRHC